MRNRVIFLCVGLIILSLLVPFTQLRSSANETLYWLTTEERDWIDDHPVIHYAYDPEYAPFEFEKDGEPRGISIEVLELLESQLGIEVKVHHIGEWSEVVESVRDRKVDMISATPTRDRSEYMNFSDPYISIPTGLIVREGNSLISSIDDLNGRYVSTVKGWFWNEILAEQHPQLKLVVYDSVEGALNAVVYGDVDATIQDFGTASYHISEFKISNLKVIAKYDFTQKIAFAVREDYVQLTSILNKVIPRISEETIIIHNRWINLQYDSIGDNSLLIKMVALISGVLVIVLLWTVSLKSQVNKKTKLLLEELEHSHEMKNEIESMNTKLRNSEREIRTILDADPSSIFVKDKDGRFLLVNKAAARTVGVEVDEMLGRTMFDFSERITEESLDLMELAESKLFSGEIESEMYTVELNDGKGNRFFHDVKKLPIIGDDGIPEMILSVATDITEIHSKNRELNESLENLKMARDQLLEQEKWAAIGAFVAGIAHDVNTPLGSSITINSHAKKILSDSREALRLGTLKKSELEEAYSDLEESMTMLDGHLKQAAELIQNFKSVSVHQITEVEEHFNLCEYLSKIAKGMKYECKMKGVTIDVQCSEDITYKGMPGLISQVFTNLIKNSLTHAYEDERNGIIKIWAESKVGGVEIVYSDDGSGMSGDTLEKIFMPFYTTKREEGGSGLGMHIVNTLITDKLNGTINVSSKLGEGVEFRIFLPDRG